MNKIYIVAASVFLIFSSTYVFAEVNFTTDGPSSDLTGVMDDYRTSNNVTLTCGADADSYAAASAHLNGDKIYGSSSGDSILYTKNEDKEPGDSLNISFANDDSGEFQSGWSTL